MSNSTENYYSVLDGVDPYANVPDDAYDWRERFADEVESQEEWDRTWYVRDGVER